MNKLIIFLFLIINTCWSFEVEVETAPSQPVKGNEFEIVFKVKGEIKESPFISFNPSGFEVIEKSNESVSIKSVIVNGRLKTEKELRVTYRCIGESSGNARVTDIKVDIAGEIKRLSNVSFRILEQEEKPKDIFVQAEVAKTDLVIGEGLDVNFYLYSKRPVISHEIKRFPQLNKFLKRFKPVQSTGETIRIGNEIYKRINVYSARLFPQSDSNVVIDPISLTVQYQADSYSPFGGMGFQIKQDKSRDISSKLIRLNVSKLPVDNIPPSFTGMIGEHEVSFRIERNKFVANDIIEMTLEVVGEGALENMSAPKLIISDLVEEFEVKSDVVEMPGGRAKKVFNYTYIARKEGQIDTKEFELGFYSPSLSQYYVKRFQIPGLEIIGSVGTLQNEVRDTEVPGPVNPRAKNKQEMKELLAPYYEYGLGNSIKNSWKGRTYVLAGLLLILFFYQLRFNFINLGSSDIEFKRLVTELKEQKATHETMYKLSEYITNVKENPLLIERIHNSRLSEPSKEELSKIIKAIDTHYQNGGDTTLPPKPSKRLLKELSRSE
ncbi:MAG: hypothetical protein Fur0010_07760 [Bdellovibrio sp.]